MSATDPTAGERHRCDTCSDTSRIPWMIEGDPTCYQEPDDEGMLPCPDCTPAEPDPVTQPADVEALTDAEREQLSVALYGRGRPDWMVAGPVMEAVERIVAARLTTVRRKAGDERAEQIAQAIERAAKRTFTDAEQRHLWAAARIARESR